MNRYKEFKNRKIVTIEQLIEKLQELPKNATLSISDADIGGYDVSSANYVSIKYDKKDNTVYFGHLENEMYEATKKGTLLYEQFEELNT